MKLRKRVAIWMRVLYSLFMTLFGVKSDILDAEGTVSEIKKGRSLIRFGDGEFGIYRGKDIHYQKWSEELKDEFEKIKSEYEKEGVDCRYILAMPRAFMMVSGFRLMKKRVYVSSWAESRLQFKRSFRLDIPYGDSFLFEKKNRELYGKIWNDESPENVIFIHNSKECAKAFENTYKKRVFFVKCPPKDAFEEVDNLEKNVLSVIEENGLSPQDTTLAISAGPAGKVLVYRMSKMGYQAIDAGHCWDDPLEGI